MFEIWNLWKMFETLDLTPIIKTTWEIAILCNGNLCQWGWKVVTKKIFKDKTVWVWRIMLHSRGRLNCLVNTQIWGWKVGRFCSNQNNAESNWRRCFYHQIWCWWYHQTNLHPCPIIGSISQTTFHKSCFIQRLSSGVFFFNWSTKTVFFFNWSAETKTA